LWVKREEVIKIPAMDWLFVILVFFFSSIAVFGAWVIYVVIHLRKEVTAITGILKIRYDYFFEFNAVTGAMGIGTTSFIFVVIACVGIWRHLRTLRTIRAKD
jgi:hypothetical protein